MARPAIEFRKVIPPLTSEEHALLEASIVREGCRNSLVTWQGILLDGHNRLGICEDNGIEYRVVEIDLPDRAAAEDWIDANQLGRRNLTPDQTRVLRGRRQNRAKGPRGGDRKSNRQSDGLSGTTAERLAKDHGVSPRTIERDAALVAEIEEKAPDELEKVISGEKKLSQVKQEIRRAEVVENLEAVEAVEAKEVEGVYDVIVIDPPWPLVKIERDCRPNQVGLDYPTMSLDQIEAVEIPCADSCHVWMWTTQKYLPAALRIVEAWGLKYVCTFVWHKPGGPQPFNLPQYNCEFVIYARKGTPEFIDTKALPACFSAPRGKHSEKPSEFYTVVRRVTAGRRLDMFNRREIEGFDAWGNES